jgi:hypothetical protein
MARRNLAPVTTGNSDSDGMPKRRRREATVAQYRALRFWADNTTDRPERGADPRPYIQRRGPAPNLLDKTMSSLTQHGWWMISAHGWIVLDAGRVACGLPPVWRDTICPVPMCRAAVGERCRALQERGTPYLGVVHDMRVQYARSFSPAARSDGGQADEPVDDGRWVTLPDVWQALASCAPDLAARVSDPNEPRHLGLLLAT